MGKKKEKKDDTPAKDEFDPVELVTKKPQTVVLMLQSQEETVLQTVCDVLFKFAEKAEENKQTLLNLGALEYLLLLVSHEDRVVKKNAIMCIGSITSDPIVRRNLRKFDDYLTSLLALLSPEEETICHEYATLAISSLAEDYTSKLEIFEKGGLPLLITMLSSPDCDVQRSSAKSVCLLLDDFQCRAAISEMNAVEPLLKLISADYPVIQEFALTALIKASQEAGVRSLIKDQEGLAKLVEIVGDENQSDLHVLSLQVLANCLLDTECLQSIQSTGVFEKLLGFIGESADPVVQSHAASVIAAAAKLEENRGIFHEQDTEATLIALLSSDNPATCISSAKALATLAENLSSRDVIGKSDGIPPLISMLKQDGSGSTKDNPMAREMASLALANLTTSNKNNGQIVIDKNAADLLIKLLQDPVSTTQRNAAVSLANLGSNETWRTDLLEPKHGLIKGLVFALGSKDRLVQVQALQALSTYLCDQLAKAQLLQEQGLPHLISLVKSNHEAVRSSASWVIAMCSADGNIAAELIRIGGLEALQEINLSSRKSSYTEQAFNRLLDSNLPSKYAISGLLKFDNIIENDFFDAGRLAADAKFQTLQELTKEPVDQKRPVILIHLDLPKKPVSIEEEPSEPVADLQSPSGKTPTGALSKNSKQSKSKKDIKGGSRTSKTPQAQEDAPLEEPTHVPVEDPLPPPEAVEELKLTHDAEYADYVREVKEEIFPMESLEFQVRALASFVCEKMGGEVEKDNFTKFSYELHISELKTQLDSNIIPIGMIKKGIYYHRAVLFKALCDQLSIQCSLVRGDYGRAWNEVKLCDTNTDGELIMPPKLLIVDLMHSAGDLYLSGSPDAFAYQRI